MNCYGLNLYNRHGKLISAALQVDGLLILDHVLDRAQGSTEYTNMDDTHLQALKTPGHASRHDVEKRTFWHHCLAHVSLKALVILPTITNGPRMTGKCECKHCIKRKLVSKPLTPTTSRSTEPLKLVHTDIRSPPQTAIGEDPYTVLFVNNIMRHMDGFIVHYELENLQKMQQWQAFR